MYNLFDIAESTGKLIPEQQGPIFHLCVDIFNMTANGRIFHQMVSAISEKVRSSGEDHILVRQYFYYPDKNELVFLSKNSLLAEDFEELPMMEIVNPIKIYK